MEDTHSLRDTLVSQGWTVDVDLHYFETEGAGRQKTFGLRHRTRS